MTIPSELLDNMDKQAADALVLLDERITTLEEAKASAINRVIVELNNVIIDRLLGAENMVEEAAKITELLKGSG